MSLSPLGVGSGEGAVPPPQKLFFNFLSRNSVMVHDSKVFLKVYIPIFACHFLCPQERLGGLAMARGRLKSADKVHVGPRFGQECQKHIRL